MEFDQKKIPFIIARPLPNKSLEYWKVSDLENLLIYLIKPAAFHISPIFTI